MKRVLIILFIATAVFSYGQADEVNTILNDTQIESRKGFYGNLELEEYNLILAEIENSLWVKVDRNKKILLIFSQKGSNCITYGFDENEKIQVFNKVESISKRITEKYDTRNLLIFSKNSLFYDILSDRKLWREDKGGVISKTIFDLKESCSAFIILKPNGGFYKYYGEDSFGYVETLLKTKKWKEGKILN